MWTEDLKRTQKSNSNMVWRKLTCLKRFRSKLFSGWKSFMSYTTLNYTSWIFLWGDTGAKSHFWPNSQKFRKNQLSIWFGWRLKGVCCKFFSMVRGFIPYFALDYRFWLVHRRKQMHKHFIVEPKFGTQK